MNVDDRHLQSALAALRGRGWRIVHERATRDLQTGAPTNLWFADPLDGSPREMTDEQLVELANEKR